MQGKADDFFNRLNKWQNELEELRKIVISCGLNEEIKWSMPCYTFEKNNILILYTLKDCCAIGFFKGVLLKDDHNILRKPGENSQSSKWVKFSSLKEIVELKPVLKAYIYEAIEVERAGLKVELKKSEEYERPEELVKIFDEKPEVKSAFDALTPGRQRSFLLFISSAKQAKTKTERALTSIPRIMAGKGMNDCVCGLSKRMPNCDGSHKFLKSEK